MSHLVRVTGDTWILIVNNETKEQSKQLMYTHSSNKPEKFKQTLSARKLVKTVFWNMKGMLVMEFMQQGPQ
jgi:hypothetical protein